MATGEDELRDESIERRWRDVLDQLAPRRPILTMRCGELLAARHSALDPASLQRMIARLDSALDHMRLGDWSQCQQALWEVGRWTAGENLAFDVLTDATHLYKKVSLPWLVRAYPGVEGFVDGLLALDELLTAAVARLADGYFAQHNTTKRQSATN
ncbi:MAG: hypothetical protein P8186_12745 [Anaerolineae bacterium]|jgi:hypothetical protein